MTCVSGNNGVEELEEVDALPPADRGVRRLLFGGELDEEAVVPADVGVREERFRAALIRTLTVDGIFLLSSSTKYCQLRYYYAVVFQSYRLHEIPSTTRQHDHDVQSAKVLSVTGDCAFTSCQ